MRREGWNLGVCGENMDKFYVSKRIGKIIRKKYSAMGGAGFLTETIVEIRRRRMRTVKIMSICVTEKVGIGSLVW